MPTLGIRHIWSICQCTENGNYHNWPNTTAKVRVNFSFTMQSKYEDPDKYIKFLLCEEYWSPGYWYLDRSRGCVFIDPTSPGWEHNNCGPYRRMKIAKTHTPTRDAVEVIARELVGVHAMFLARQTPLNSYGVPSDFVSPLVDQYKGCKILDDDGGATCREMDALGQCAWHRSLPKFSFCRAWGSEGCLSPFHRGLIKRPRIKMSQQTRDFLLEYFSKYPPTENSYVDVLTEVKRLKDHTKLDITEEAYVLYREGALNDQERSLAARARVNFGRDFTFKLQ
jgi:hypothetical protein